ncbi:hypothetical protein K6T82_00515 [Flavobacterium sp. 17A]|uniref:Uncharacterized protein n=1 Tax=Flavobacterium potami TaxID=2872310 RepID=A0A9X1KNL1_9FLAO|nr:hypothetical protein [Flavobacterium potami]MBZ4033232.1 hypothetical protein [Flavobacterium potami]
MKSKFKILPILLISYLSVLPLLVVYFAYTSPVAGMVLPILFLLFVAFFWLTVIRTRAYRIEIDNQSITTKRYFGIGKAQIYNWNELDGFITLFESAKGGLTESIFILEKDKRVGSISSFYHSNFYELKTQLQNNLVDLGERKSTFKNEYLELFQ